MTIPLDKPFSTYGITGIGKPTQPPSKLPRRLPCPKCGGTMDVWNKQTKQVEECDQCCDYAGNPKGYIENLDGDATPEVGQHD